MRPWREGVYVGGVQLRLYLASCIQPIRRARERVNPSVAVSVGRYMAQCGRVCCKPPVSRCWLLIVDRWSSSLRTRHLSQRTKVQTMTASPTDRLDAPTTSKHPPLPSRTANNSRLILCLRVRLQQITGEGRGGLEGKMGRSLRRRKQARPHTTTQPSSPNKKEKQRQTRVKKSPPIKSGSAVSIVEALNN